MKDLEPLVRAAQEARARSIAADAEHKFASGIERQKAAAGREAKAAWAAAENAILHEIYRD